MPRINVIYKDADQEGWARYIIECFNGEGFKNEFDVPTENVTDCIATLRGCNLAVNVPQEGIHSTNIFILKNVNGYL